MSHQITFSANWIWRDVVCVEVISPAPETSVDAEIVTQHTSRRSVRVVVDAHAIEAITILIRPGAGNAQGCSKAALHVASALGGPRLHAGDAGLKSGELSPVAPVKGRVQNCRGTDVSTRWRGSRVARAS